jgi:hypothetical protein
MILLGLGWAARFVSDTSLATLGAIVSASSDSTAQSDSLRTKMAQSTRCSTSVNVPFGAKLTNAGELAPEIPASSAASAKASRKR